MPDKKNSVYVPYKARKVPWELTLWPMKTKAAGSTDATSTSKPLAVAAPGGAATLRCDLMQAVPVERWSAYVPYRARTVPWELILWPMKTKAAGSRCDIYKQAARAVAASGGAAILSCALIQAVPVERWSVSAPYKVRTVPWELTLWPMKTKAAGSRCDIYKQAARAVAASGGAAILSCALIQAVPVERWSVYVLWKAKSYVLAGREPKPRREVSRTLLKRPHSIVRFGAQYQLMERLSLSCSKL